MRTKPLAVLLGLLLWLAPAQAHLLTYEGEGGEALFRIRIPVDWSLRLDPDRVDLVSEKNEDWIGLWRSQNFRDLSQGQSYAHTLLDTLFEEHRLETPEKCQLHSLPAWFARGSGLRQNRRECFSILIFQPSPKQVILALRLSEEEPQKSFFEELIQPERSGKK